MRSQQRPRRAVVAFAILIGAPLLLLVSASQGTSAEDTATWCKWPQLWPYTLQYQIRESASHFTSAEATRVSYGGNTWSEANFNLIMTRNQGSTWNIVETGPENPAEPDWIAEAAVVADHSVCDDDPSPALYRSNFRGYMKFMDDVLWHTDCLASPAICAGSRYDLHNVAVHEFGHWFHLSDTYSDPNDSMYHYMSYGETKKRSLYWHDRQQAWIMYGCRNGGTTYNC